MKVFTFSEYFNSMIFSKKAFLMPMYLSRKFGIPCDFYYGENNGTEEIPEKVNEIRFINYGVRGVGLKQFLRLLPVVIKEAKSIKCVFTLHLSHNIMFLTYVYKWRNPKGLVWVCADGDINNVRDLTEHEFVYSKGFKGWLKRIFIDAFFHKVTVFSVDTIRCYDCFRPLFNRKKWHCLEYVPCGFDEDTCNELSLDTEKENEILFVGRVGSYQKNTEMLLEGIARTQLGNWKVNIVGPYTSDFSYG